MAEVVVVAAAEPPPEVKVVQVTTHNDHEASDHHPPEVDKGTSMRIVARKSSWSEAPVFVHGELALKERGNVIIAMTIGNPYFSKKTINTLIPYNAKLFSKVYIFIPVEAARYVFMAVGFKEKKARQILNQYTVDLRKFCLAGIERAVKEFKEPREKFIIVDCEKEICPSPHFIAAMEFLNKAYDEDKEFHADCNMATREVLACPDYAKKAIKYGIENAIVIAVTYVLSELAMLATFDAIFNQPKSSDELPSTSTTAAESALPKKIPSTLFYHRPWLVFEKLFSGKYRFSQQFLSKFQPSMGLVIYEACDFTDLSTVKRA